MRLAALPIAALAVSALVAGAAALYARRVSNAASVEPDEIAPEPKPLSAAPKPPSAPRTRAAPTPPKLSLQLMTSVPEAAPEPKGSYPLPHLLPFDLEKLPVPSGFEGIPIVDKFRNPASATMDDNIVEAHAGETAGVLKIAAGCLKTIQTDRPGWVSQFAVLNVVDTEKGYRIESVQILPLTIQDDPDGQVTASGYEECMQRVYATIKTVPAVDGWPPKPGTKRRVLLESAMPPGHNAQ